MLKKKRENIFGLFIIKVIAIELYLFQNLSAHLNYTHTHAHTKLFSDDKQQFKKTL